MTETSSSRADLRTRIVDVAARLLREEGPAAVTTRGVAQRAGVQAPAIYRIFGDKDGLLEAVAEHVMATFVSAKAEVVETASANGVDPLEDLHSGWRTQIDFGLANPDLFRLLSDPGRVASSPAAETGRRVLEARVRRVAETGLLRVSEHRAVGLIQSAGIGAISTLLATRPERRDLALAEDLYEAVLHHILTGSPARMDGTRASAVALRATAPRLEVLSQAERQLLAEWLDRAIEAPEDSTS